MCFSKPSWGTHQCAILREKKKVQYEWMCHIVFQIKAQRNTISFDTDGTKVVKVNSVARIEQEKTPSSCGITKFTVLTKLFLKCKLYEESTTTHEVL